MNFMTEYKVRGARACVLVIFYDHKPRGGECVREYRKIKAWEENKHSVPESKDNEF